VSYHWHLVKNLAVCVSVQMAKMLAGLRQAEPDKTKTSEEGELPYEQYRPLKMRGAQQAQLARQAERMARYEQIQNLYSQGMNKSRIAVKLGISRNTVQRWLSRGDIPYSGPRWRQQNRHVNRLHKVLEDANLKLSSVVTDVMGVTGRAILQALVAGQEDAEELAKLARGSLRSKQALLAQALRGRLKEHHRFMLKELLDLINYQDRAIDRLDRAIAEHLRPFEETIDRLDEVTGLSRRAVEVLLAEIGTNMDQFPTAAHVSSWVGICPGNYESGGKRLSGKIRKGNRWVKTVLVQAAHATSRTNTYLGEQYRRLAKRRGSKKAAVAVGHSILVIAYHMLKTGETYKEKGAPYFDEFDQQRVQHLLVKRLEHMGYQVTLQPTAPAA